MLAAPRHLRGLDEADANLAFSSQHAEKGRRLSLGDSHLTGDVLRRDRARASEQPQDFRIGFRPPGLHRAALPQSVDTLLRRGRATGMPRETRAMPARIAWMGDR